MSVGYACNSAGFLGALGLARWCGALPTFSSKLANSTISWAGGEKPVEHSEPLGEPAIQGRLQCRGCGGARSRHLGFAQPACWVLWQLWQLFGLRDDWKALEVRCISGSVSRPQGPDRAACHSAMQENTILFSSVLSMQDDSEALPKTD